MKLFIPPPTAEQLASEWIEKLADEHQAKVTVTIERYPPVSHTISIDRRPEWIRRASTSSAGKEPGK